jgi:hypothetical protein
MTTDGVELNYLLEGPEDAPVLVTANSLGTTFGMWDASAFFASITEATAARPSRRVRTRSGTSGATSWRSWTRCG